VSEETGLTGTSKGRIDKIGYWFWRKKGDTKIRHHKLVYFYLIEYTDGSTGDHDYEVYDARWFPYEEALQNLTFQNEREILEKAYQLLVPR
jgi:bis(5'-nucleosidyl)-tetraphosphatase